MISLDRDLTKVFSRYIIESIITESDLNIIKSDMNIDLNIIESDIDIDLGVIESDLNTIRYLSFSRVFN